MMKHTGVFGLIAVLAGAMTCPAAPTAVATYESLGLYWDGAGGAGVACSTFYRVAGALAWNSAQNLWWDSRDAAAWHGDEYRGSIVGLKPGTTYNVRLKLSAGTEETINAATWTEVQNLPITETVTVPSRQSGYVISDGGSASGYILYDGHGATISGGNEVGVTVDASHIILRGLTVTDVGKYGIELKSVSDVIIDSCDISLWGTQCQGAYQTEDDCGIYSRSCGQERITIQNCNIHHPRYDANNWQETNPCGGTTHPGGANALAFEYQKPDSAGNYVIRRNRIYSDYTHMFNDGMGADHNFSFDGFPIKDSDIYGNHVSHVWDDALEIEGGNMNVRVWGNVTDSINISYGLAVTTIGPLYVFRNISRWALAYPPDRRGWEIFKMGNEDAALSRGPIYIYHNTVRQPADHGEDCGIQPTGTSKFQQNVFSRNNILHTTSASIRTDAAATMPNSSFDYDLCTGDVPQGQEQHGILGKTPAYKDATDMLDESSPGHDAAILLPNFNDKSSAWPYYGDGPDMGAVETGAGTSQSRSPAALPRGDREARLISGKRVLLRLGGFDGNTTVELFSPRGRLIRRFSIVAVQGASLELDAGRKVLLQSGLYFITVSGGNARRTLRFSVVD